uniref:Uncharacterized protein LOC111127868 n=1 Tax=Crassostrea virginica TaxID=6565 RepID=A0A8B8DL13_CRAVI|nr:uncharacterized protein LOC111127868 [Crassostrea virginica]
MMLTALSLQLILIISSVLQRSEQECLQGTSTRCCADFYFDDGTCKPCEIGYFGPNCGKTCPYPKYGRKCVDGECNCLPSLCDFAVGCLQEEIHQIRNLSLNEQENTTEEGRSDGSFVKKSSNLKISFLLIIIVALVTTAVVSVLVIVIIVRGQHSSQSTRKRQTERKTSSTDG